MLQEFFSKNSFQTGSFQDAALDIVGSLQFHEQSIQINFQIQMFAIQKSPVKGLGLFALWVYIIF